MRSIAKQLVVATVTAGVALTVWPAHPAMAGTGNPYDLGPTYTVGESPVDYPRGLYAYYVRPDASNWGWVGQALPGGLANGRGQNVAPAANAAGCIPAATETPNDSLISYSAARLETVCVLHPGDVAFQVGATHRGKNRDGMTYSNSGRMFFVRYSQTSDCLFPTVVGDGDNYVHFRNVGLDMTREFPKEALVFRTAIPASKVGLYMCVAQGFDGQQKIYSNVPLVGVDDHRWYHVRGPWTSFHVIAAGASDKPSQVTASAGNAQAVVNWQFNGDQFATTSFTATSTPDSKTCRVVAAKRCTITGLRNGVSYTFAVTAERNGMRQTSDASAAVTPVSPAASSGAAASPAASQPAPLIVNASSLRAAVPSVEPVRGNTVEPLTTVRVTTVTTGTPANGETVRTRTLVVCLTGERGDPCRGASRTIQLQPNIAAQTTIVWIPRNAGGKFLRIWQNISTSLGPLVARPAYTYVRNIELHNANVNAAAADAGLPAGADAGVIQEAPAEAAPAGAAPGNAEQSAAGSGAAAAPAAESAAASGDAAAEVGGAEAAARAAGVDLANSPVADAAGQGTGASAALTMQLAASSKVNRGRAISLKAVITPKASAGRVRIALVRVTPRGKYVSTKALYAPVKVGTASKRWRIPRSFTPAQFTLVATFEPSGGGPGITRTAPVTIG